VTTPNKDIDLMLLADGELGEEEARELARALEGDESAQRKLEALGQVGDTVRTYLEDETDRAAAHSARFARLWDDIERGIRAEPAPATALSQRSRKRPGVSDGETDDAQPAGFGEMLQRWFGGWRGNVVSGLVAGAAVVALVVATRPFERVVERQVAVEPVERGPVQVMPAALQSQPPEIEDLEIFDGSGIVLTVPGEDEDSPSAVIWISNDDKIEGPI
jgi:hypothetical protein